MSDMFESEVDVTARNLRKGVEGGVWHLEWTASHPFTGCKVIWETKGSVPNDPRARATAMAALRVLVSQYGY